MTMIDAGAISRSPSGAGRYSDWIWPDPLLTLLSSSGVLQMRNRMNGAVLSTTAGAFNGGGAQTLAPEFRTDLGCGVVNLFGGLSDGAGQLWRSSPSPWIFHRSVKGGVTPYNDDMAATRAYACYAYVGNVTGVVNSGFQITTSGGPLLGSLTPGFGFNRRANGVIAVVSINNASAATSVDVTGPGTTLPAFNEFLLNAYEIQMVSATPTVEAYVNFLINGRSVRRLSWGAGSILPTQVSTNLAWTPQIFSLGASTIVRVNQARIIQAPTITDAA